MSAVSKTLLVISLITTIVFGQGQGPPQSFNTTELNFNTTITTTLSLNGSNETCCGCLEDDGTAGCEDDPLCEQLLCNPADGNDFFVNARCCTNRWKQPCVNVAEEICLNPPNITEAPTCCSCLEQSNFEGGCALDEECESQICAIDAFCCDNRWDGFCTRQAFAVCNGTEIPPCCSCTVPSAQQGQGQGQGQGETVAGCASDQECNDGICAADSFCCTDVWDSFCVQTAVAVCNGVPFPTPFPQTTTTTVNTGINTPPGDGDQNGNGNGNGGEVVPVFGGNPISNFAE